MNREEKILDKTLELLHQPGYWYQGGLHRKNMDGEITGSCLMGCVYEASCEVTEDYMPAARILRTLEDLAPPVKGRNPVSCFNDDPNTTVEDVILLVKQVIYSLNEE